MYYPIPTDPRKAKDVFARFFRENLATSSQAMAIRRRPLSPRDITIASGTGQLSLSWLGPTNMSGIIGFNLYKNDENTFIQNIVAVQFPNSQAAGGAGTPSRYRTIVAGLTSNVKVGFYLSAYTALLESIKVPFIGTPN
jgi:hypothetical protein